jgi:Sulfatase-modifying factor enzyme 1
MATNLDLQAYARSAAARGKLDARHLREIEHGAGRRWLFAAWLFKKTGKDYRLLSEAEREYVTRAGTTTPFWWGSSITPKQANYNGNFKYAGGGSKGEYRKRTMPVDSFEPNP